MRDRTAAVRVWSPRVTVFEAEGPGIPCTSCGRDTERVHPIYIGKGRKRGGTHHGKVEFYLCFKCLSLLAERSEAGVNDTAMRWMDGEQRP